MDDESVSQLFSQSSLSVQSVSPVCQSVSQSVSLSVSLSVSCPLHCTFL